MPIIEDIKCIFCLNDKPPSIEHVVPKSLGGNLTIRFVCKKCNGDLSSLDQSLAEASLLVLPRLVQQPKVTWGRSAQLAGTEELERPLEVKMGHKLASTMKTQLVFLKHEVPDKFTVQGSGEDTKQFKDFFKILRQQIAKNGSRGIKTLANIHQTTETDIGFRLVLNRTDDIVFRPSSEAAAEAEFSVMANLLDKRLDEIEKNVLEAAKLAPGRKHDQPEVMLGMTIDFGKNLRAVSKIAYTFLAATYGPALVMEDAFTPFRQYILNGTGADDQGSLWWSGDGKEKSLSSSRFATWLKDLKGQPFSFGKLGAHTVTISQQYDRHLVLLEFYDEIAFAVDVGDIGIPLHTPHVHEFDFVKRSNQVVPPQEILQRFTQKLMARQGTP